MSKKERKLRRALSKCFRFSKDVVVAYCTPVDYQLLCEYFNHPTESIINYYTDKIKAGDMGQTWHYFKVLSGVEDMNDHGNYKHMREVSMVGWSS